MKKWQIPKVKSININCTKDIAPQMNCDNGPNGTDCSSGVVNWQYCPQGYYIDAAGNQSGDPDFGPGACAPTDVIRKCRLGVAAKIS